MGKEMFFDMLGEYDNFKVIFYNGLEILSMFDMSIENVEEYDDEIIIRGVGNSFVILTGEPDIITNDDLEKEFIFNEEEVRIGIIFNRGIN